MNNLSFSLCPEVDISDMFLPNPNTSLTTQPSLHPQFNQPQPLITPHIMNKTDFDEQYYKYTSSLSLPFETKHPKDFAKALKKKRERFDDPGTSNFKGPWAKYKEELLFNQLTKHQNELTEEQKEILANIDKEKQQKIDEQTKQEAQYLAFEPKSIFHLSSTNDYKGKSFIEPPNELKNVEHTCYIPKKNIYTYKGHTKPVQVIRFFPQYGHFLLSCSLDSKIILWDVLSTRKCVQTYLGHSEGVRDVCFSNDGKHFLSAGFDKLIRYWDTEKGKVIKTFQVKKIPFCVLFHPDKQDEFLVGTSSKQIYQYNINEPDGKETNTYDEHLGAINTLTFIDGNRKFVSTSDDKKIFIWEYGLPVVVKHISEPSMHSIPAVALHPSEKYFVGQSLDNKIVVYDCRNGFKINRKKKFTGHVNAGYSCGLDFSPDGQFLCSGDADGKLWFWDWRTSKNYTTLQGHDKICNDVKWHPIKSSLLASCSWDNTIKLWDSR